MSAPTLEVLRAVCADDDHYRPALRSPMRVVLEGDDWTVGTDGHRIIGVRGLLADGLAECPFPTLPALYANAKAGAAKRVQIADIRTFLAANLPAPMSVCAECGGQPEVECEDCDGDGETSCECMDCGDEHTRECRTCDGKGRAVCAACRERPVIVPVGIDDKAYNVLTAAPMFAALPDAEVEMRSAGETNVTTFLGDGWFAAVMPVRVDRGVVPPTYSTQGRAP